MRYILATLLEIFNSLRKYRINLESSGIKLITNQLTIFRNNIKTVSNSINKVLSRKTAPTANSLREKMLGYGTPFIYTEKGSFGVPEHNSAWCRKSGA